MSLRKYLIDLRNLSHSEQEAVISRLEQSAFLVPGNPTAGRTDFMKIYCEDGQNLSDLSLPPACTWTEDNRPEV